MQEVGLWSIDPDSNGPAEAVEAIAATKTEERLEDWLVQTPELLGKDVTIVGRQLPTEGGPLDLLGVDGSGRLVVFELKRGTLTRDAVAQVVDYASDLARMSDEQIARLIEEKSGEDGVDEFEDFLDWYRQEFAGLSELPSEPPRMVLVGLGADDRARRMVQFLNESGIDIGLITFFGFELPDRLLLARHLEFETPAGTGDGGRSTKESNQKALNALAESLGALEFLEAVSDFIGEHMDAYRWPGKTAYSFSLEERTDQGRPSYRNYATLYVDTDNPGRLLLYLAPRAVEVAESAIEGFASAVSASRLRPNSWASLEVPLSAETWPETQDSVGSLLDAVAAGWSARRETQEV